MINFPWHVDFGAGVATTLAICAITALSHDQGHTGFHGRFRCCLSSGFPSKIKQSIRVDNAVGETELNFSSALRFALTRR